MVITLTPASDRSPVTAPRQATAFPGNRPDASIISVASPGHVVLLLLTRRAFIYDYPYHDYTYHYLCYLCISADAILVRLITLADTDNNDITQVIPRLVSAKFGLTADKSYYTVSYPNLAYIHEFYNQWRSAY